MFTLRMRILQYFHNIKIHKNITKQENNNGNFLLMDTCRDFKISGDSAIMYTLIY